MSICYYSANKVLDRLFGLTAITPPASYFFGLSTSSIQIDGTGATEPSGSFAYARVELVNNTSNWGSAASGAKTNSAAVTFAESTGSWGTVTNVFLADALTSGNIWWFDTLTPSRAIPTTTTVLFAIGAITVQYTNS